jgi:CRISPR/Cas system-associated exonuclease Cas4 (RecB family)
MKPASFSVITAYERCAYTRWHHLQGSPRVEAAADGPQAKGNAIHAEAENYLKGNGPVPEWPHFQNTLINIRRSEWEALAIEQLWCFDADWKPCSYNEAWVVAKADVAVRVVPGVAIGWDWKGGKPSEVKHGFQAGLYAVAMDRYWFADDAGPVLIDVNMAYVPTGKLQPYNFNRARLDSTRAKWTRRIEKMMADEQLLPNPTPSNCKYCDYRATCQYSVRPEG